MKAITFRECFRFLSTQHSPLSTVTGGRSMTPALRYLRALCGSAVGFFLKALHRFHSSLSAHRSALPLLLSASAVSFLLFFPCSAHAQSKPSQVEPNNTTGTPPFGSFGGQNENVNLANGNLNISIPLFSFGARGMGLSLNAVYDSKIWHPSQWFDETILQNVYDWDTQDNGTLGWNVTGLPALTAIERCTGCDDPVTRVNWYEHFIVTLPDGSRHEFPGVSTLSGSPKISDTNDGTLLRINITDPNDAVVHTTDGLEIHFNTPPLTKLKYIVDRNGNKLLFNYNGGDLISITDVAGRQIVNFSYTASQTVMTVSDSNGIQRNYIFNGQQITKTNVAFQTPFVVKDVVLYFGLTSIILPTGLSYDFLYNEYGELIKITYPTGAYTRYDYSRFTARHLYEGVNSDEPADFREVTARHVSPDGVTEHTTTYTPTVDGTVFNNTKMTITDALGNKSEHFFFTSTFAGTVHPPREIKTILYDGQTNALVQTDRTFSAFPRSYPTSTTTTLLDKGIKNKVENDVRNLYANLCATRRDSTDRGRKCHRAQ